MSETQEKIVSISLDESSIKTRSLEAEHERVVAITDLLHDNQFEALCMLCGPYDVKLSIKDNRLCFDIHSASTGKSTELALAIQPLRGIIRDYFMICESYYEALKKMAGPSRIEAIDMGRRGIHNEGSEILTSMLEGRIRINLQTARRLFTLICVLHIK
ncbi:MAG: UPF0262 family protein [Rickettsiales bacterium]|nr:UPF0262 family protein [Rickettsiales bacterium]